jgi:hypothetical protein
MTALRRQVADELSDLLQKPPFDFFSAIDSVHEDETYFLCTGGAVLRVLRGPATGGPGLDAGYAAVLEFYSFDGTLMDRHQKRFEPSGMFALHYTEEVVRSQFYKLSRRPSFVPPPNTSYRTAMSSPTRPTLLSQVGNRPKVSL